MNNTELPVTDRQESVPPGDHQTQGTDSDAQEDVPELQYPTLEHFVNEFLCRIYERDTNGQTVVWCPTWWLHDGAVFRFTALWQAWESMRLNEGPTAADVTIFTFQ